MRSTRIDYITRGSFVPLFQLRQVISQLWGGDPKLEKRPLITRLAVTKSYKERGVSFKAILSESISPYTFLKSGNVSAWTAGASFLRHLERSCMIRIPFHYRSLDLIEVKLKKQERDHAIDVIDWSHHWGRHLGNCQVMKG